MKNAKFTLDRVCGYMRPVNNWNKGKREEFKERRMYNEKNAAMRSNAGTTAGMQVADGVN